jgi:peptide/nickel transport system permease protein
VDRVSYVIGRILQMIPTVIVITVLIFLMVHMIPGDPATLLLGPQATPDKIAALTEHMGLNQPLYVQFGTFVRNLSHGDLGDSLLMQVPVMELVKTRLPLTLSIVVYAVVLAILITIPMSVVAALNRDSWIDQVVRAISVGVLSTPQFWIGIILLILLGIKFPIFPVGGTGETFTERLYYLFLPAFTISLHLMAVLTRNLRDGIIATLDSDHVVFARAKGLRERSVLLGHVLRNAMVSAVTILGVYLGWLVGGSVIIETVFALPGMGYTMVTSILGRDYPVVQGMTLVFALMVSVVYIITDVAYSFLDPRVTL